MGKLRIFFLNMARVLSDLLTKARRSWVKKSLGDISQNSGGGYYGHLSELPLHNWIQCTDGKLHYVRKGEKGNNSQDLEAWEKIYNDYLKEYGLSKTYKKMLEAIRKKALAELDFVITNDRFKLTEADIQESILSTMLKNKGNGMTIEKTLIHLSKWIGYWLKPKNISTKEYFDLLAEFEKMNKSQSDGEKDK